MNKFDDALHTLELSEDGSYTAYSKEYDEHYHSTRDGALSESLKKHIIPAFKSVTKDEIVILDICYGLGFNTLATLLYVESNFPDKKIKIYSPELDASLIYSLENFLYPAVFEKYRNIILKLSRERVYQDKEIYIEIFLGDAREYIKQFDDKFDIVYQDAFSPSVNPILWTKEYFRDIKKAMKKDAILTTYSIALRTRLSLYENGFNLYINRGNDFRESTVASLEELESFEKVNMQHKISCNPTVKPFLDSDNVS